MPTADRRRFIPAAIRLFLEQDYENKELLIVDDGVDRIEDLVPEHSQIRYIGLSQRTRLGTKRNLACEAARGDVIVHWDDDDWHAPWRVRYQFRPWRTVDFTSVGLTTYFSSMALPLERWEYVQPSKSVAMGLRGESVLSQVVLERTPLCRHQSVVRIPGSFSAHVRRASGSSKTIGYSSRASTAQIVIRNIRAGSAGNRGRCASFSQSSDTHGTITSARTVFRCTSHPTKIGTGPDLSGVRHRGYLAGNAAHPRGGLAGL